MQSEEQSILVVPYRWLGRVLPARSAHDNSQVVNVILRTALVAIFLLFISVTLVRAFAEEPLTFRDPYTGQTTQEQISTLHDDLTYALALAAGFSVSDSITLQLANQLVDSEMLGEGTSLTYTNCSGSFSPPPDPRDSGVCGRNYSLVTWPLWENMQDPARCTTSRYGPYMPFFHFPHQNTGELRALHDWGWGLADSLVGYEAYAWGGPTLMTAKCAYTQMAVIITGMEAGSLEAFATYLHSLADSYSHRDCVAAMDRLHMPWATHTLTGVYPCNYNPSAPTNDDAHGREYGRRYTDTERTDAAILAIYSELVARSEQREGRYVPLGLDTRLALAGNHTLSETLYAFVHDAEFSDPGARRTLADQIAATVLAQRQGLVRCYLPLIMR